MNDTPEMPLIVNGRDISDLPAAAQRALIEAEERRVQAPSRGKIHADRAWRPRWPRARALW